MNQNGQQHKLNGGKLKVWPEQGQWEMKIKVKKKYSNGRLKPWK